jgi:hypothetical protein
MPRLQELAAVLRDHPYQDAKFVSGEFGRGNQRYRIERELRQPPLALHVNMRRLGPFVAEKEEPVRPNPRNGRHLGSSTGSIQRSVAKRNRGMRFLRTLLGGLITAIQTIGALRTLTGDAKELGSGY